MHTLEALSHIVAHNQTLAYLMIFFFTIFEGEIISISAGILVLLGGLNFFIALLAIICGGMIKSFLGYFIGTILNDKVGRNRFFDYIEKKVLTVMPHFEKKPFWSIFASKFLLVNHVIIIFSGYKKIEFKKYIQAEISSTIIWSTLFISLGYFFSYTAFHISRRFSEFALIIVLFILGLFVLEKIIYLLYDVVENFLRDYE